MSISKTIHYCWFGRNPKPPLAEKCIKSWRKYCPDYQIIEWNEDNYDLSNAPLYVRQAYQAKKWAFVTDYVRLDVVNRCGGIYLDTDVELLKSLDPLLCENAFFGFENTTNMNTGLGFGSVADNAVLKCMLADYENIPFLLDNGQMDLTPCPVRNTASIQSWLADRRDADSIFRTEDAVFFPPEYFCPLQKATEELKITEHSYSVHWFGASWYRPEEHIYHKYLVRKRRLQRVWGDKTGEILVKVLYRIIFRKDRKIIMGMV